jgi:hypothetical protein
VTIVTAMWLIPGAKHSIDQYIEWMKNFMLHIDGNMVIYTSMDVSELLRGQQLLNRSNIVLRSDYETPFEIPCIQPYAEEYKYRQHELDPENKLHKPELYAIWNGKNCLMQEVANSNPFQSTHFIWADMGALRDTNTRIRHWPDRRRIHSLFQGDRLDKMVFGGMEPIAEQDVLSYSLDQGPVRRDYIQGGFFGGSKRALQRFSTLFWKFHDEFIKRGFFVGKDQNIMCSLLLLELNDAVLIPAYQLGCTGPCGDQWFYFFQYLASKEERNEGCKLLDNVYVPIPQRNEEK